MTLIHPFEVNSVQKSNPSMCQTNKGVDNFATDRSTFKFYDRLTMILGKRKIDIVNLRLCLKTVGYSQWGQINIIELEEDL